MRVCRWLLTGVSPPGSMMTSWLHAYRWNPAATSHPSALEHNSIKLDYPVTQDTLDLVHPAASCSARVRPAPEGSLRSLPRCLARSLFNLVDTGPRRCHAIREAGFRTASGVPTNAGHDSRSPAGGGVSGPGRWSWGCRTAAIVRSTSSPGANPALRPPRESRPPRTPRGSARCPASYRRQSQD